VTASSGQLAITYYTATFANQFHLKNTGQYGAGSAGNDVNVEPVWASGMRGENITIDVLDDGLQYNHAEFAGRIRLDLSYNYETNVNNPTGGSTDDHGTGCGGMAAASDTNGTHFCCCFLVFFVVLFLFQENKI